MVKEKQLTVKLWFNQSNSMFYVQINEMLFIVRDTIVTAIQEKEQIEIMHAKDIRDIQFQDRIKK